MISVDLEPRDSDIRLRNSVVADLQNAVRKIYPSQSDLCVCSFKGQPTPIFNFAPAHSVALAL